MEKLIEAENLDYIINIFGSFDKNIKLIEKVYDVNIISRATQIKITGESGNVNKAEKVIKNLIESVKCSEEIDEQKVKYYIQMIDDGNDNINKELENTAICISDKGRPIKPKTLGQKKYINLIENNTIVFAIGPAGTGKTYLAVAYAVRAFKSKQVSRIILTRPAVEAGEKLGFLPGDLQTKVDPYLRPLYDALFDMLGVETFNKCIEKGTIEVAPLAYMRGRTLDDSFIILDEAQNTTNEQMKMFLTRIGFNSRIIVTGDVTQIDLPDGKKSGLIQAVNVLKNVEDIGICTLSAKDVVRHPLVQSIIRAYEKFNYKSKKNFENKKDKFKNNNNI